MLVRCSRDWCGHAEAVLVHGNAYRAHPQHVPHLVGADWSFGRPRPQMRNVHGVWRGGPVRGYGRLLVSYGTGMHILTPKTSLSLYGSLEDVRLHSHAKEAAHFLRAQKGRHAHPLLQRQHRGGTGIRYSPVRRDQPTKRGGRFRGGWTMSQAWPKLHADGCLVSTRSCNLRPRTRCHCGGTC